MSHSIALRSLFGILFLLLCAGARAQDQETSAIDTYHVLPGDLLQVSVWNEPELEREVLIRPDGGFSFPLAGDVPTNGRSIPELQTELTQRLSRYISDPVVTVSLTSVLGNKVYVIGQVNNPGEFVVNPRVDVMQALSMAGGTTPFASLNDIRIIRRSGDRQTAISFRYDDVVKGRDLSQNIVLQSGDIVVVP